MDRLPNMRHTLFTIPGFLTHDECEALVRLAESYGFSDAPITTAFGFVHAPEVRNNTRVMVDDGAAAARLWEKLRARVGPEARSHGVWQPVGLNERLRFYRYEPGQAFRWHHDGAFRRNDKEASRLTFIVYLNDDFEGGETEFEETRVVPERGAALVFSHPMLHQGAEVRRGVKYVLRSDVMFRFEETARRAVL